MSTPPDERAEIDQRARSLSNWEEAASGWLRRYEEVREFAAPLTHWLIDAINPQPGQRVLELAAGLGETGLLAAELVAPIGGVIVSDQAEAMLAGARERAAALDLSNVEFSVLNAEWIDLPLASVDAVICRWGYMLMIDPSTALRETRRVLRPGGTLALAVWDRIEENPWASLPAAALRERGLAAPPQEGAPGPFALSDPERLRDLLGGAGFLDVRIEPVELTRRHATFDEFWDVTLDLSRVFHDAVLSRPSQEIDAIRSSLEHSLEVFRADDGSLSIPARSLAASAEA
ncbi:MAG TPA: methyltransferase domain-containing protein [Solirubrobacteraceae bacterium]|nr:methyltransferase domain-containing protein [Solirubrobacteraceae bacterium]